MNNKDRSYIVDLREKSRLTFKEIGMILGVTRQRAWTIYKKYQTGKYAKTRKNNLCESCFKKKSTKSLHGIMRVCDECFEKLSKIRENGN